MRLKRILIIGTIFPVLFSIVLFFGILISGEDDDNSNSYSPVYSGRNLSADVLKHQPMVEKYARENGISEYVNVLLAIIQVESGGTATDVMEELLYLRALHLMCLTLCMQQNLFLLRKVGHMIFGYI